ncbi:MAG TPA: hypothetical protein VMG08_01575 [Allosphingosinicella sp.]|nr:hypothetical protein [Allosphingosinicella sp.]
MTAVLPNLFKGIALVIDNSIGKESEIDKILANITASGGHYISMAALPADDYDLEHLSRVSFFIMDWNLKDDDLEPGVKLPDAVQKEMAAENIAFLKRLSGNRHAPVFIFTNEVPDTVVEYLSADPELLRSIEESHILVKSKADVMDKLYEVLEEWAKETPSVLTLKSWERGYLRAANDLFIDLHNRTTYWPVLMWQTFSDDEVPPEFEMAKLLNRLVESRMGPLELDLKPYLNAAEERRKADEAKYRESMYKVLEGERFLREERLTKELYAPGDLFAFPVDDGTSYWLNLRAECDCLRGGSDLELYLLKAQPVLDAEAKIDPKFGTFLGEKDNEAIIFAMVGGTTFSIKFKDMKIKTLKQIGKQSGERVGRLLPPFITRVQQRYAAYVERPGLPRIPAAMRIEEQAA